MDHRSDLFSLGCVLYVLCCRRAPFASESIAATLRKVDACQAPAINVLAPSIPSSLVEVINRLMARNPADRFQTAAAVAEALRALSNENLNSGIPETGSYGVRLKNTDDRNIIAPHRSKNGRGVRRWLLLLGVLIATISVAVFVIDTDRGEFVLTTDDPDIAASITKSGGLIVENRRNKRTYTLQAGANRLPNGDYDLVVSTPDGLQLSTPRFQLNRFDGKVLATVTVRRPSSTNDVATIESINESPSYVRGPVQWSEPRRLSFVDNDSNGSDFNKVIRMALPETWQEKCAYAPSMTADGKLLVFTSNRIAGKEGFESGELWQSQRISQD